MAKHLNKPRRIIDPKAVMRAKLAGSGCVACGRQAGDGDHVLPRGKGGDDVVANIVLLCGSGTSGCHGAKHGTPYEIIVGARRERRDQAWVMSRTGAHLLARRPDTIAYILEKMGDGPGRDWLYRTYYVVARW